MRLLEGAVVEDFNDGAVRRLEDEIHELKRELSAARAETRQAKAEAQRAVAALRKQLAPLYQALRMVFGEIDAVGGSEAVGNEPAPRIAAVWQAWKDKIGGQPAQLIDALLLHGELTSGQIAVAIGINPKNVAQVVHKLNKAGLVTKNGGKFSLKQL
jgi:ribosomal protein L29